MLESHQCLFTYLYYLHIYRHDCQHTISTFVVQGRDKKTKKGCRRGVTRSVFYEKSLNGFLLFFQPNRPANFCRGGMNCLFTLSEISHAFVFIEPYSKPRLLHFNTLSRGSRVYFSHNYRISFVTPVFQTPAQDIHGTYIQTRHLKCWDLMFMGTLLTIIACLYNSIQGQNDKLQLRLSDFIKRTTQLQLTKQRVHLQYLFMQASVRSPWIPQCQPPSCSISVV